MDFDRVSFSNNLTKRSDVINVGAVPPSGSVVYLGGDFTKEPGVASPACWLAQDGWTGIDAPQSNRVLSPSPGGIGAGDVAWKPQPRRFSVPFIKPSNGNRTEIDQIVYSGKPVTVRFLKGNTFVAAAFGCRPLNEVEVNNRTYGDWQYRIGFESMWPWFLEGPVQGRTGVTPPSTSIGDIIAGCRFTGLGTGVRSINLTLMGSSWLFTSAKDTEVIIPSPPFQTNIDDAATTLKLYAEAGSAINVSAGSFQSKVQAFYMPNRVGLR